MGPRHGLKLQMGIRSSTLPQRGRALLERLLRHEIRGRLGPLLELRGRSRYLDGGIHRSTERMDRLESAIGDLEQSAPKVLFSKGMTMDRAWKHHSGAPGIFARHHLPACDSCAVRFDESLDEAASAYGLDLNALLKELNSLLEGP
jgi:hypothetical protein